MGNLSLKDNACILISLSLALMFSAAEQNYFYHDWRNLTWDQARNHCQVCFKELVTLTPENIKSISRKLTSDSWIGLRKHFHSAGNSSVPWSRWADGEPLIFQNWYPGWPVSKSSMSKKYCCTCPAKTTTTASFTTPDMTSITEDTSPITPPKTTTTAFTTPDMTSITEDTSPITPPKTTTTAFTTPDMTSITEDTSPITPPKTTTTASFTTPDMTSITEDTSPITPPATATPTMPEGAECVGLPDVPNENYIQDSCVAMLSFGPWVEKKCSERLPFICYEDRFFGEVTVTERTNESAVIKWQPGPGDISHYRIEVRSNGVLIQSQTHELTQNLVNLTGGNRYSVQVFPVKCNRDLDPQKVTFFTTPNKVENLTIATVTQTSVFLRWNKPAGRVNFYRIEVQGGKRKQSDVEHTEVGSLIPGNGYTFTVLSGVSDSSLWSEGSNITAYTKPGTVSNLRVTDNTKNWLQLKWVQPEGNTTGYLVKAINENDNILFDEKVSGTEVRVTELPQGAKITLSVTALTANDTLEGDEVSNISFTVPGPISNLTLRSTYDSITATWESSAGNSSSFTVKLQLKGKTVSTVEKLKERRTHFDKLKTAANYTVIVYTVTGPHTGTAVQGSIFTAVLAPTNASVKSSDKNQITFEWTPPDNTESTKYFVNISSSFWGHSWSDTVEDKASYRFDGLTSGTSYDFEVRVLARNGKLSDPATVSQFTEADKREISLAMLCSSAQSLLCDDITTRENVFDQLCKHFEKLLGNKIFWKLEKQETEN